MGHLRTFLLILLTVLLPIRGALAGAMLYPGRTATAGTPVNAAREAQPAHGEHGAAVERVTPLA